MIDVIGA